MHSLVFLDDSGDPGFDQASSDFLIMSAICFANGKDAEKLSRAIMQFKNAKRLTTDELKFSKTRKDLIVEILKLSLDYKYTISATYIDKTKYLNTNHLFNKDNLYNFIAMNTLSRAQLSNAKIYIDGRSSKSYMQQQKTYLKRSLNSKNFIAIKDIRFIDSRKEPLIQFADIVAGSVNRFLQINKTDSNRYLSIIKNNISSLKEIQLFHSEK